MPSSIGGTPNARAISRAAICFGAMKSISRGLRLIAFQSSPPSRLASAGRRCGHLCTSPPVRISAARTAPPSSSGRCRRPARRTGEHCYRAAPCSTLTPRCGCRRRWRRLQWGRCTLFHFVKKKRCHDEIVLILLEAGKSLHSGDCIFDFQFIFIVTYQFCVTGFTR
jgi:hypothetical protein